jgi:DNA recombination protein RmuC
MEVIIFSVVLIIGLLFGFIVSKLLSFKKNAVIESELNITKLKLEQAVAKEGISNDTNFEIQNKLERCNEEKLAFTSEVSSLLSKIENLKLNLSEKNEDSRIKEVKIKAYNQQDINQQKRISELEVDLQKTIENMQEKFKLLDDAKLDLSNNFKVLANDIFTEKSKSFVDISQRKIDDVLKPFKSQLSELKVRVEKVYSDESQERSSLKGELKQLLALNQQMNVEAKNLTRALKGDKQKQGAWGELVLERVLETSGLRNGVEYETQISMKDENNKQFRPDVIVRLPEGKDIIIDSKVSLNAYESYVNSSDESEKNQYLKIHVQAVKTHIESLSDKKYEDLPGVNSLDFILMFMPIESAFVVAFQHDEDLFQTAFKKKIVVVTPTTLLATLGTIKNTWRYQHQNINAQKIAVDAGKLLDKFRGFVEDFEKMGSQISTVAKTHELAMNKLSKGKGNLISQTIKLQDLGVQMKKDISSSILDKAEIGEE